jgi:predicted DNA-binding ribbon-helix-helix protein
MGGAMNSSFKRSIGITDHEINAHLEDEFWKSLREIARERGKIMSQPITSIEAHRQFANLLSAIRLFILRYRDQLDQQKGEPSSAPEPSHSIEHRTR